jgi:hypothetical protein
MPALGYHVPLSSVESDHRDFDAVDFNAEYLGWIPTGSMPLWSAIAEGTWRGLIDGGQYDDPIAIGIEATPELTAASIGMAARRPDGDHHVELIDKRAGVNWLLDAILSLCRSHAVCAIGLDRNGPLAGLVTPLTRAAEEQSLDITIAGAARTRDGSGLGFNSAEVAAACATIYNETGEQDDDARAEGDEVPTTRRVHHLGQPELDSAVGGAVKHFHGDRWRWDRSGSAVDVSPLFAVTLALAAGESEEWIGGAYDIKGSLG